MLRYAKSSCCKRMFQLFQIFQRYVASISYECCKSRSGCCTCYICCKCFRWILQVYCSKCFSHFRRMLHVFYQGVAHVSHICCKCFIRMLHMFHTYIASVSSRCSICFAMSTHVFFWFFRHMLQVFQLLRTDVANVSSKCYKSRLGVAHVAVRDPSAAATYCSCWAHLHARGCGGGHCSASAVHGAARDTNRAWATVRA
jgi:hypothetical protein